MQLDRLVSSYCSTAYCHLRLTSRIRHLLKRYDVLCWVVSTTAMVYSVDWTMHWPPDSNEHKTLSLALSTQPCETARSYHALSTVWDGEIISRLINRVRRRDHITPYQPCETVRSYHALSTVWDGEIISRLINRVRRRDHITPYQPCERARSYHALSTVWDGEIISRLINRVRRRDHITPYQPCETARSYHALSTMWDGEIISRRSVIAALAADQDESHIQDLNLHVQDLAWLSPGLPQLCDSSQGAYSCIVTGEWHTRLAVTGGEQRSEGAALPWQTQPCGTFSKVCEINRDIGSFPKQKLQLI